MIYMNFIYVIIFHFIPKVFGDDFNLYGEAGQAYALKINIGHPPQTLSVLVDTGSATLAIASYPRQDSDIYFHSENSTSIYHKGKQVQAKYFQGTWVGQLVSDFVQFPSLSFVEVRTDIALITKSHKFFMNGSGWQGLLGLAYLPVGAWGDNVIVGCWLDSVEKILDKPVSFELKLCGTVSQTNSTHYGSFKLVETEDNNGLFKTPILRKRWYEVGVLSVRLLNSSSIDLDGSNNKTKMITDDIEKETCIRLNEEKSIVDSGTTNIRLPDLIFRQVVDQLRHAAQVSNNLILDEFWYHGEAGCWPEPQEWSLPSLAIDILSMEADNTYFTLEVPAQNFMRVVTARNNSRESGSVSEFCYKLGIEGGGKETVLGYTAMEGFNVIFNRSGGWIGWRPADCGAKTRITGPFNVSTSFLKLCQLTKPLPDVAESIRAAQWILCAISIIAAAVVIYLIAPSVSRKVFFSRPLPRSQQISLSQAALVQQEAT